MLATVPGAVLGREGRQALAVSVSEGLQVAQHQHRHLGAHCHFDLGQSIALVHAADQLAKRRQQAADVRRQDLAGLHVGHIARFALVKAHQNRALFGHVAHRQAGAVAVAPSRAFDGAHQQVRFDLAQVPEVVLQHPLFDSHLSGGVEVLHLATTTQAKVSAFGRDTLGALDTTLGHVALLPVVLFARDAHAHLLARQCPVDENDLAVVSVGQAT